MRGVRHAARARRPAGVHAQSGRGEEDAHAEEKDAHLRVKTRSLDHETRAEPQGAGEEVAATPTRHRDAPLAAERNSPQPLGEPLGEPLGQFYAFPTTTQLLRATEDELRGLGFGYRAKFIAGAAAALAAKEKGAEAYLASLRSETPYREAQAALTSLPGVGPKVAACACLFSLDKHEAVPVDTHVWQLAVEHYTPDLQGKTLARA